MILLKERLRVSRRVKFRRGERSEMLLLLRSRNLSPVACSSPVRLLIFELFPVMVVIPAISLTVIGAVLVVALLSASLTFARRLASGIFAFCALTGPDATSMTSATRANK